MNILILYGTVEGHTARIARFLQEQIEADGHKAILCNTDDAASIPIQKADAVILAASVHQRRHPKSFETTIAAHAAELARRKTLMLSVSLSAAFPEGQEEADDYLTEMKMRTHFSPDEEMLVPGALRASKYDYFAMQVIQHVVLRGRKVDPQVDEHSFTDWDALRRKLSDFLALVQAKQSA